MSAIACAYVLQLHVAHIHCFTIGQFSSAQPQEATKLPNGGLCRKDYLAPIVYESRQFIG